MIVFTEKWQDVFSMIFECKLSSNTDLYCMYNLNRISSNTLKGMHLFGSRFCLAYECCICCLLVRKFGISKQRL